MTNIEVRFNPPDLPQRMKHYPQKLQQEMERTMKESLIHVQGSVPPYPPARPTSRYIRTGTLGRSIGLGGRADIYEVRKIGGGYEARLGTNLSYAPAVIGTESPLRWIHDITEQIQPTAGRTDMRLVWMQLQTFLVQSSTDVFAPVRQLAFIVTQQHHVVHIAQISGRVQCFLDPMVEVIQIQIGEKLAG